MDALQVGLRRCRHTIPPIILQKTFIDEVYRTVEAGILNKVYKDRIIPDIGLYGYNITNIRLSAGKIVYQDANETVIEFDSASLDHKEIIGVYGAYDIETLKVAIADTANIIPGEKTDYVGMIRNSRVSIVGKNTVKIETPYIPTVSSTVLRVDLFDTNDLSSKSPKSLKVISEIIEWGVKAYIYNTTPVASKIYSSLTMGSDSDPIMDRIETYSEAEEKYMELLEEYLGVVTLMEDTNTHHSLLSLQAGGMVLPGDIPS